MDPRLVGEEYSNEYELSFIFLKRKGCNVQSTYNTIHYSFSSSNILLVITISDAPTGCIQDNNLGGQNSCLLLDLLHC